jgi:hypothetical protein
MWSWLRTPKVKSAGRRTNRVARGRAAQGAALASPVSAEADLSGEIAVCGRDHPRHGLCRQKRFPHESTVRGLSHFPFETIDVDSNESIRIGPFDEGGILNMGDAFECVHLIPVIVSVERGNDVG